MTDSDQLREEFRRGEKNPHDYPADYSEGPEPRSYLCATCILCAAFGAVVVGLIWWLLP